MTNGNGAVHIPQTSTGQEIRWKETAPDSLTALKVSNIAMLTECWPYVRVRLERMKSKDKSAGNWTPEHLRFYIQEGLLNPAIRYPVELYLAVDAKAVIHGFLAGGVKVDPYINIPLVFHIWAAWLNRDIMERLMPWLEQMTRERGLTAIEFESGRLGWMGAIRGLGGFTIKQYVFTKKVAV